MVLIGKARENKFCMVCETRSRTRRVGADLWPLGVGGGLSQPPWNRISHRASGFTKQNKY
jgi:hypothetical protein